MSEKETSGVANFVVIRFSVRLPPERWRPLGKDEHEAWFRYRARIFSEATYPCLARQSRLSKVYLLIDPEDAGLYTDTITDPSGILCPLEAAEWYSSFTVANAAIQKEVNGGQALVARIDSDDLVADDYLDRMSEAALTSGRTETYLVATCGYRSDLRVIQQRRVPNPPFIAAYQREFRGADFSWKHTELGDRDVIEVKDAAWVQIIHGSNISNEMKMTASTRVSSKTWPSRVFFPPQVPFDRLPAAQQFRHYMLTTWVSRLCLKVFGGLVR